MPGVALLRGQLNVQKAFYMNIFISWMIKGVRINESAILVYFLRENKICLKLVGIPRGFEPGYKEEDLLKEKIP